MKLSIDFPGNDSEALATAKPFKPTPTFWQIACDRLQLLHQSPLIQPAPRNLALPLSFNQERLWKLEQLQLDPSIRTIQHSFHLVGTLNVPALEQSLNEVVGSAQLYAPSLPLKTGNLCRLLCQKCRSRLISLTCVEFPQRNNRAKSKQGRSLRLIPNLI